MRIFHPVADQVVKLVASQVKEIHRKSSSSPKVESVDNAIALKTFSLT
jgi:hypothetical protein